MQLKSFLHFSVLVGSLTAVYGEYGPQLPEGCKPFEGGYECTSVTEGSWETSAVDSGYGGYNPQPETYGYEQQCKLPRKIALLSDNNKYLGRCKGCVPYSTYPNNAFVHGVGNPRSLGYLQWDVVELGNGKIALRSDTGKYLARCDSCYKRETYRNSAGVHVLEKNLPHSPWAQWELSCVGNNQITLKSDTGYYLSRCQNCVPRAAYPNSAFVHGRNPSAPYSIWKWVDLTRY